MRRIPSAPTATWSASLFSPISAQSNVVALLAERPRLKSLCCIRHFVSSPQEVAAVKRQHPQAFCITPGVRPAGTSMDDQKRVDTPTAAILNGADMLVVGRPITQADDPAAATVAILAEINAALASREQAQASA
ncbi:MAG: hypothetical protein EBR79_00315 [Proteobacteria bacterium]|nr:hypothetical protein [Pseudomonadota bacterium]